MAGRRRLPDRITFEDARRLVTWHYQWIIVNEFLPAIVGRNTVLQTLESIRERGPRFYTSRLVMRPAFPWSSRSHPLRAQPDPAVVIVRTWQAMWMWITSPRRSLSGDLRSAWRRSGRPGRSAWRGPSARRFNSADTFFDFGGDQTQHGTPTRSSIPGSPRHCSISRWAPSRAAAADLSCPGNLLRHLTWSLPSGQDIAEEVEDSPPA